MNEKYLTTSGENSHSKLIFQSNGKWILEISDEGISFNRDQFPDMTPGDFVSKFIDILETNFNVKFIKKETI